MTNNQTPLPDRAPEFLIQRIYVKDLSLECPRSPQVFQEEWRPELNLQVTLNTSNLSEDSYELVVQVTVTASAQGKTLFLVEIKQAGLFKLQGFTAEQNQQILGITCPTILFPYAREAVSNLVGRAGFPPLYLAPVNFEALYTKQVQEKNEGNTVKKANTQNSTIVY